MSDKEANNNPGLCPVKGQYSSLYSWTKTENQFLSLSLGAFKTYISEFPVKMPPTKFLSES